MKFYFLHEIVNVGVEPYKLLQRRRKLAQAEECLIRSRFWNDASPPWRCSGRSAASIRSAA
jgi:hypothetical protein